MWFSGFMFPTFMLHVGGWPPYELLMTSRKSSQDLDRLPPNQPHRPWHLVICICSCRSVIMVILPARSKMLATSCIKRTGQVVIISLGAIWGMTSSKLWSTPNLNFFQRKKSGEKKKTKKNPMKHDRSWYPRILKISTSLIPNFDLCKKPGLSFRLSC